MSCIRAILLAIAFAWASSAEAVVTVVQKVLGTTVSGSTVTGTLATTTTGNTIVVLSGSFSGASGFSVSSIALSTGSGTFSRVITEASSNPAGYVGVEGWAAPNIVGGTTPTVTVTYTGAINAGGGSIEIYEIAGMSATLFTDGTPSGLNPPSSITMSTPAIRTTNTGSIIFAAFGSNSQPQAGEAGWTAVLDTTQFVIYQYQIQTTAQPSILSTGTQLTSAPYDGIIFALAPSTPPPIVGGAVGNRHINWN